MVVATVPPPTPRLPKSVTAAAAHQSMPTHPMHPLELLRVGLGCCIAIPPCGYCQLFVGSLTYQHRAMPPAANPRPQASGNHCWQRWLRGLDEECKGCPQKLTAPSSCSQGDTVFVNPRDICTSSTLGHPHRRAHDMTKTVPPKAHDHETTAT